MEKQTPVRWLVEKLNQIEPWYSGINVPKEQIDNLIKIALEMEEQFHKNEWIDVIEQTPPLKTELLVKSPTGVTHIASWRAAYNIFTCQCKSESTLGWKWKLID